MYYFPQKAEYFLFLRVYMDGFPEQNGWIFNYEEGLWEEETLPDPTPEPQS